MRFTAHSLRSLIPALAIAALAALTANSASAQSRIDVPFNFVAAGAHCTAGTYTIMESNWGTVVSLRGTDHSFTWLIGSGDPAPTDTRVVLTFDRMGNNYALRTVQYGPEITTRLDKNLKESIPTAEQVAMTAPQQIVLIGR